MGLAAVENLYGVVGHVPSYGPPGVGINPGVIMMNLTRMRMMSGGASREPSSGWWGSTGTTFTSPTRSSLCILKFYFLI